MSFSQRAADYLHSTLPAPLYAGLLRFAGDFWPDLSVARRAVAVPRTVEDFRLLAIASFEREPPTGPYAFGSTVCRSDSFLSPLYRYWCDRMRDPPRFHRKQWEFVYIAQVLFERGYLVPGSRGVGFGVGNDPLPDLFCSMGCEILATDLGAEDAEALGWIAAGQHASATDVLYRGFSERADFDARVSFRPVNMNAVPQDIAGYDFAFSSCAIEHVGSLGQSQAFLRKVLDTLRPGGLSVHTTEFNVSSDEDTVGEGPTVLFRRRDLEAVAAELRAAGHFVEPLDFHTGSGPIDRHLDLPPFRREPHLKLVIERFATTSFGLVVRKAG